MSGMLRRVSLENNGPSPQSCKKGTICNIKYQLFMTQEAAEAKAISNGLHW